MSLCGCCRRGREADLVEDDTQPSNPHLQDIPVHLEVMATQTSSRASALFNKETPGQTAHRLRGELEGMRQQKEDEKMAQRQKLTVSSQLHQRRMDDMKANHDRDMEQMIQSRSDDTTACNSEMAQMNEATKQQMGQQMADHEMQMKAMRRANDGVEVKRNERMNVLKLANAQRLTNMTQRIDAQCSDLKQRQRNHEMMHSQRMKVLSFSHCGVATDARNRNRIDMEAQRQVNRDKQQAQKNRAEAANNRHHQYMDGEALRHGREMGDMKTSSDAKTAKHEAKMVRMNDKNKHKTDDANHMALQFVSLENKLKQSQARCAMHERTLAANSRIIKKAKERRELLVAQSEVVRAIKQRLKQSRNESAKQSAAVKHRKFSSEDEECRFVQKEIKCALANNESFDEEMSVFMEELIRLNGQMRVNG